MTFEIERELASALYSARVSGDTKLAKSCDLSAVPDSTGGWSIEVKAETVDAAFAELHRMVNDNDTPLARARQIRLYLAWKGHVESQYLMGENFRLGRNIGHDYALARYWYEKAAGAGHPSAQNNLGFLYAKGFGGSQDLRSAIYWYAKSAENGNAIAKSNLAQNIVAGKAIKRDYMAAARLLKESLAAYPYYGRDHFLLAQCYEHGVGGRNGRRLALYHYQEASDFGSFEARAALRRLARQGKCLRQSGALKK